MGGAAFSFRPQLMQFQLWDSAVFTDILYPGSIYDLISYHVQECVKREIRLRGCKNCGRYFYMSGRNTAMYCCRPHGEKGYTCRKNAPIQAWAERNQKDEIFCEYRREYKRRFAWINAGKIERDAFMRGADRQRKRRLRVQQASYLLRTLQNGSRHHSSQQKPGCSQKAWRGPYRDNVVLYPEFDG